MGTINTGMLPKALAFGSTQRNTERAQRSVKRAVKARSSGVSLGGANHNEGGCAYHPDRQRTAYGPRCR